MQYTLTDYRKAASMTQCQMADRLKVSQGAISQWERGDTRPDIRLIPELARAYGTTEGEIIAAITAARQETA